VRLFAQRELKAAYAFAEAGGQALHVISGVYGHTPGAPAVFRNQAEIAHLIDNNLDRLVLTAKHLGVRVIKVERAGREGQHVDLCRKPLDRARVLCETEEML
jgi:hypothetical protein